VRRRVERREDQVRTPQPGVFAQGTRAHYHLELDLRPGATLSDVSSAVASLREPTVTSGGANLVVGFGPELWRRLVPEEVPESLAPFPDVPGTVRTQHDLWVWSHGTGTDLLLDVARAAAAALAPVAALAAEVQGFVYRDSRDLTGFIDGTENPPMEAAPHVAAVAPNHPGEGGCFAITQRWVHDLAAFEQLPVAEQEHVIGRRKLDSVELADDDKPPTAHIARVVIEEDGEELEIYRRSVPYGSVRELGLFFVAFSADPTRFEKMLRRMFGASGDGVHDRLTEFSRPVSGSAYFVPALEQLRDRCPG
jgi:putative iron-dependent peroxidase